jgi:hypothetical protein
MKVRKLDRWLLTYSFLIITVVAITISSRLLFNGDVFDFDFHLYQPDGAVYTYLTLKWLGNSHVSAAEQVIAWYEIYAEPESNLSVDFFDRNKNPGVWSLAAFRILYSLLSMPFVAIFGIQGMLFVPILSLIILFFLISLKAWRNKNPLIGLILISLLSFSPTLTRWYISNITDGLLATLFAFLLLIPMTSRVKRHWAVLGILILLTSFTRFCAPYWYAIAIFLLIVKKRSSSIFVFTLSTLFVIPTLWSKPDPGSIVAGVDGGAIDKLLYFPVSAIKIFFIEGAQLAALDRPLLLIVGVSVFLSLIHFKSPTSKLFLVIFLAGWFIGSLNGVLGVNFRYQLPLIPFASLVFIEMLKVTTDRSFRNILLVGIEKDDKKL